MARTISVTKSEVTLNHGSVPFAPPANVVIKNYTTINLNYTFTYSGLGSGKKLFLSSINAYSNAPLRPGKEFKWMETINYWENTSTVASGSKSFNLSYVPDPSAGLSPEYPEFDELLPGDEFAIGSHMTIFDVVNYDWAIEDSHISTFEYAEWEPPQIVSYTAYRANSSGAPDDAGTKIRYSMNASVLPLTGYGHGEFFIRYKRPADASWTEVSLGNNITSINVSNAELSGNFPLNESYIIQFVAYDGYVSAVAQTQIYTGTTCMHFNAQKDGIGIGKYSEGPGFDVGWDTRFRGNVQFDNPAAVLAKLSPVVLMRLPTAESATYNETYRYWLLDWTQILSNYTPDFVLGGASGQRKFAVRVAEEGFYHVHFTLNLSQSDSNSGARVMILRLDPEWEFTAARDYMVGSEFSSATHQQMIVTVSAYSNTTTCGEVSGVMHCEAGQIIMPTFCMLNRTKTIASDATNFSMQRIG